MEQENEDMAEKRVCGEKGYVSSGDDGYVGQDLEGEHENDGDETGDAERRARRGLRGGVPSLEKR